jgi:hypothetical protein
MRGVRDRRLSSWLKFEDGNWEPAARQTTERESAWVLLQGREQSNYDCMISWLAYERCTLVSGWLNVVKGSKGTNLVVSFEEVGHVISSESSLRMKTYRNNDLKQSQWIHYCSATFSNRQQKALAAEHQPPARLSGPTQKGGKTGLPITEHALVIESLA